MADRYWVGGTATWDDTAGTKWAATSGGTGGESVPTSADDVFFDANSGAVTVTLGSYNAKAKNLNFTGFTGTLTGTNKQPEVYGSLTLAATMTLAFTNVMIKFLNSSTATLTSAGLTIYQINLLGSGTVELGDALTTTIPTGLRFGAKLDTKSYAVTGGIRIEDSSSSATITLGSSTITGYVDLDTTGTITLDAGTSQINGRVDGPAASGLTFYNVTFTDTTASQLDETPTGGIPTTVLGSNTFNNLTFNAAASSGVRVCKFAGDTTVNGTLTLSSGSTDATQRSMLASSVLGTARTFTVASISGSDCDFRDITLAGAAAGSSITRAGDCGGNSGITFPAAKTVYRVGANTTWPGSSSWATSSGGSGSNDNLPLAQDTAVIDNNGSLPSTISLSPAFNIGALDCSGRTSSLTLNFSAFSAWHKDFALGSGITVSNTNIQSFYNRSTIDFTSTGKTITFSIEIPGVGGTFQLADALSSTNSIALDSGTFNANNYNVTCTQFNAGTGSTRTVTMGSGLWTLSGTGTVWSAGTVNTTVNKDTANILLTNTTTSSRTFTGGNKSYNKLTIGGSTGTSIFSINNTNDFTELASTKTVAHTLRFGADQGTIGTWSITGTSGNVVTFISNPAGTRRTFTLTNVTEGIDYLSVKDIGELSDKKFYVGVNSIDGGNNSNVYFSEPIETATGNMMMLF